MTVECANNISTAREQKGLGTIGVRHDGQQVVYKVSVHHVVRHSRPASVHVTFVSFIIHYYFVTRSPLNPGGIVALHWFGEYVSRFFSPTEVFWIFVSDGVTGNRFPVVNQLLLLFHMYVVHACCCWCEAERNQNKPNGLHLNLQ